MKYCWEKVKITDKPMISLFVIKAKWQASLRYYQLYLLRTYYQCNLSISIPGLQDPSLTTRSSTAESP